MLPFCFMSVNNNRLAYYLWQYPKLSETFIQREVTALRKSKLHLEVIADMVDPEELLDETSHSHTRYTSYLFPIQIHKLFKYISYFSIRKPTLLLNCLFHIINIRYQHHKSWLEDIRIFFKSVYLAGVLRSKKINHAHCPWSDVNAFILLIASRLAGITYSVQVRAHDIHRKTSAYALEEKFGNAEMIFANCRYNAEHVKRILPQEQNHKVKLVYEGLDLDQFSVRPTLNDIEKNGLNLLIVARIIEQKGIDNLLQACKRMRDMGIRFRCKIIGGTEFPLYRDYFDMILDLHRTLDLKDHVFFLGPQPFTKVLEEPEKTDIFVLPSTISDDGSRDITPNSLLEAMAMKVPVITTQVTGIQEIVDNGINGVFVPERDDRTLANEIVDLMYDIDRRKRLGENARKKIEVQFDIHKNIQKYVEHFEEAMSRC